MEADVIKEVSGNLLEADVDALVNTVNTVGVMGKGIALQFKRAYPEMFTEYAKAAKAGSITRGKMHVWETGALSGPKYVINFPTKGHWRAPSRLPDIEAGLDDLIEVVEKLGVRSIAVPPLGAGNGGLDWELVEPLIRRAFARLTGVEVHLYPPGPPPRAAEMLSKDAVPKMTAGRAALVASLTEYSRSAITASPLEVQKLMYFLQEAGEPLRLKYTAHHYGPYADNLRHVLRTVEGHLLVGFGDGTAKALEAEPLEILPGAASQAQNFLADRPETVDRVERVMELAQGFESMYGLELLSTVHWVATRESTASLEFSTLVRKVHRWSPRKQRMFSERHIEIAFKALCERGWIPDQRAS